MPASRRNITRRRWAQRSAHSREIAALCRVMPLRSSSLSPKNDPMLEPLEFAISRRSSGPAVREVLKLETHMSTCPAMLRSGQANRSVGSLDRGEAGARDDFVRTMLAHDHSAPLLLLISATISFRPRLGIAVDRAIRPVVPHIWCGGPEPPNVAARRSAASVRDESSW